MSGQEGALLHSNHPIFAAMGDNTAKRTRLQAISRKINYHSATSQCVQQNVLFKIFIFLFLVQRASDELPFEFLDCASKGKRALAFRGAILFKFQMVLSE
jgi:hypothetical protein